MLVLSYEHFCITWKDGPNKHTTTITLNLEILFMLLMVVSYGYISKYGSVYIVVTIILPLRQS